MAKPYTIPEVASILHSSRMLEIRSPCSEEGPSKAPEGGSALYTEVVLSQIYRVPNVSSLTYLEIARGVPSIIKDRKRDPEIS